VFEFAEFYDYSSSYPDGAEVNSDEVYQPELLQFNDNMQLVLPSGVTLGHRALKVYYRYERILHLHYAVDLDLTCL